MKTYEMCSIATAVQFHYILCAFLITLSIGLSLSCQTKITASEIVASVKDTIEPEKEVICDIETFSTVYRAKIKGYSQIKFCPHDFRIDCGRIHLAGHCWAVYYYPSVFTLASMVELRIILLTYTTKPLKIDIRINLIAPSGRRLMVVDTKKTYYNEYRVLIVPLMRKFKLDSSEYVKDDCLSFECIMSITKWSPPEVVKRKEQAAITSSNSQ